MVLSAIVPEVEYPETTDIDAADRNYAAPVFSAQLAGRPVRIVVGKLNSSRATSGIIFAALYISNLDNSKKRIGVCEVSTIDARARKLTDPVTITAFSHIRLFSPQLTGILSGKTGGGGAAAADITGMSRKSSDGGATTNPNSTLRNALIRGILISAQPILSATRTSWVARYFRNPEYCNITSPSKDIFTAVVSAMRYIGFTTSVAALRAAVVAETQPADFAAKRDTYLIIAGRIRDLSLKMSRIAHTITPSLKSRAIVASKRTGTQELPELLTVAAESKAQYVAYITERGALSRLLRMRYIGMQAIDTFEKYKVYLQTQYIADEFAHRVLEDLLSIKIVIFSKAAFISGDMEGVVEPDVSDLAQRNAPKSSRKFLLLQRDSPLKMNVVLYSKKGLCNVGDLSNDLVKHLAMRRRPRTRILFTHRLCDDMCALTIGATADDTPYPCMGTGEWFHNERRLPDFAVLSTYPKWRQVLDDSWVDAVFVLQGRTYASVNHYCASRKYIHSYPDRAASYTIESGDVRSRGDVSAYHITSATPMDRTYTRAQGIDDRLLARAAKFEQHPDLVAILLATGTAELRLRGNKDTPDEPATDFMQLRNTLLHTSPAKTH